MTHGLPFGAVSLLLSTSCLLAQITPGNLLVSRIGDGTAALTNAATARFLDEYTPNGTFVQTIALPTVVTGANRRVTDSGTATSNGFVTQSADGNYLLAAGYDAAVGTAAVTATPSATTNRVIARIALDGTIDTSTALTDAYSANNFRGVASVDGSSFWISGTGTNPGARFVASLGATTSTQLSTTVTNLRCTNIYNGQLYGSSASGAFLGVSSIGSGLPTTAGQTITSLTGGTGASGYDFYFADASTLYVADDRVNGSGGIQKWTLAAGVWTLAYTLAPNATTGCRGLSGFVDNGVVTLFATTAVTAATTTTVVAVTDTGPGAVFTTLVTNAANTALRDVQYVRTPTRQTYSGTACATSVGIPTVGTGGGSALLGNTNFAFTAGNALPNFFVMFLLKGGVVSPFGIPLPGAPACALVYVLPDVLLLTGSDALGNASTPLPIPASNALAGATLAAQVAAFDPTLVGFDILVGTSNALQVVVGN